MAKDLTEPTLGYLVTPITWDGANFHPLLSTVAGLLEVSVEAATEIVTHCMGHDGGAWVALHTDAAGDLQTDVLSIVDGQIRNYVWDGAIWRKMSGEASGYVNIEVQGIKNGEIRNYVWDGALWKPPLAYASGVQRMDIDSLRSHNDVIPMHYHSTWRKQYIFTVTAGQSYVESEVVPPGYMAFLTTFSMETSDVLTTTVYAQIIGNGQTTNIVRDAAPTRYIPFCWTGMIAMQAGDLVRITAIGTPIDDTIQLDLSAYFMRIP